MEDAPVLLYILLGLFSIILMIVVIREFFMKPKSKEKQSGTGKMDPPTDQGIHSNNIVSDATTPVVEEVPSPMPEDLEINNEITDSPSEEQ
jgi:hypothetical protein